MELQTRLSSAALQRISEEAMLYMCACPGQVAAEISRLRELHRYQQECLSNPDNAAEVHHLIAGATAQAHAALETCLEKILDIEGWDRRTLKMPEGLRQQRDKLL